MQIILLPEEEHQANSAYMILMSKTVMSHPLHHKVIKVSRKALPLLAQKSGDTQWLHLN